MSTFEVLDNVAHADLKVDLQFGDEYRNNVNHTVVFATEFQALQREYPIYFRKSAEGNYYAIALLGLDKDENLFLENGRWMARYIPAVQMSGPFALELPDVQSADEDPRIRIDVDDSRVGKAEGQNIFLPLGGHSPFFEEMLMALKRVHIGAQLSQDFFAQLESFDLIEEVTVQANYGESLQYTLSDMYSISQKKLAALSGNDLQKLNELGLLEHCYSVIFSNGNMSKLVDMKLMAMHS